MYLEDLVKIGLTEEQSKVYETLLKVGSTSASNLATETNLNRTLVYKYLEELESMDLVKKSEVKGKVTSFQALHPEKIKDILLKRRDEVSEAEASYSKIMGRMLSDYNLLAGKPGVQLFEGYDVFSILDDTLYAKTEVKQFIDVAGIQKYAETAGRAFSKQRNNRGIKRKLLAVDNRISRERAALNTSPLIEWRFLKKDFGFGTTMYIYDNKVSYTTVAPDANRYIGVIVADATIAKLHEALFDYLWEIAERAM